MSPTEQSKRPKRPAARRRRGQSDLVPAREAGAGVESKRDQGARVGRKGAAAKTTQKRPRGAKGKAAATRANRSSPGSQRAPSAAAGAGRHPGPSGAAQVAATQPTADLVTQDLVPHSAVQDHLYEIQRNLDSLLRDVDQAAGDANARKRAADAISHIASQLDPGMLSQGSSPDDLLSGARKLTSLDYYARHWSRLAMRNHADEVDEFGLDQVYEQRVQPLLDALFERYFRVSVQGMEHIPASGGALLVCNRGGTLPWDAVMMKTALRHHGPKQRAFRWLTEDFNFHAPFLGPFLNRIGAVRACQANAERLLDQEALVGVFPEGIKGVSKLYGQRYQLQRFGRGGHVKLALRKGAPIIPAAIVGAEDATPLLYRLKFLSRAAGVPFFPITPTFPWLGPAGLLPLPSRWHILVGEPIGELSDLGPDAADQTVVVHELNERIRTNVQQLVDDARSARGSRTYV